MDQGRKTDNTLRFSCLQIRYYDTASTEYRSLILLSIDRRFRLAICTLLGVDDNGDYSPAVILFYFPEVDGKPLQIPTYK